jgi:outer membrane protein OmpA-like peptidoglycan-associated protein
MDSKHLISVGVVILLSGCTVFGAPKPEPVEMPPLVPPVPVVETIVPKTLLILFESDVTTVTVEQRQQIRDYAAIIKRPSLSNTTLLVIGHTDSQGDAKKNKTVGMNRAEAVAQELVFNGIRSARITIESRGEDAPIAQNLHEDGTDNSEGRASNRRVEVIIRI